VGPNIILSRNPMSHNRTFFFLWPQMLSQISWITFKAYENYHFFSSSEKPSEKKDENLFPVTPGKAETTPMLLTVLPLAISVNGITKPSFIHIHTYQMLCSQLINSPCIMERKVLPFLVHNHLSPVSIFRY